MRTTPLEARQTTIIVATTSVIAWTATSSLCSRSRRDRGSGNKILGLFYCLAQSLLYLALGSFVALCGIFALGRAPFNVDTLSLSVFLSSLAFVPRSAQLSGEVGNRVSLWPGSGALFGGWLGAITIPLDWGRPWQLWPLPIVTGAAFGYANGALCCFIATWWRMKKII